MQPERATFASGSFAHIAALYGSDDAYLDLVLPAVGDALKEGRDTLVVTGQANLDLLAERLGPDARRIDRRLRSTWYTHPARTLTAYHEYAEPWAKRQALFVGEPVWAGRDERDVREWLRYEAALNIAFEGAPIVAMCLFDRRTTPPEVLEQALCAHPWLLEGSSGPRPNPGYVPPRQFSVNGDDQPFRDPPGSAVRAGFTSRELTQMRHLVETTATGAGLDRDTAGSLVLSASEIAANAVEHGAGHGTVQLWTDDDELICEIADPAGQLDVPLPGYLPPRPESPRGYGLWISRQLCDLVETRTADGVLRVRLHMFLPRRG
ncbi:anti-sigma regulatory factor (Ser/Thr protein kinase) [Thermocatellispora tengchongensis]|uniref:Anti-sigma regulatory factor (Ser/Thr protein kinase) n=1 Tax=Thermocatellispora tengchongensis TaxID=1073253 RepID=A0A840NUR1_9ACTN|nr:sensor histidine kinase [Thermocatellispora tengchongensis]MBB5132494.1 anti-sigma regulatory factor (Ser/Thr protein kinase) [Thermocatellispora tengchongensis]